MALQTQGFQVRPPPIPQIPSNVGKIDVRAIYDSVMDGLKTGGALRAEPARQAAEQQKLMLAEKKAIAEQAALPSATRANIAGNEKAAIMAAPEIVAAEANKTLTGLDADLIAEQNRRTKARTLATLSPEQQLVYDKFGPSKSSTLSTVRLPDGNISSQKTVLAQVGDQAIPIETVNNTGPYAAFAGIPNAIREFELMTAGMTPEQKERARQFAVGIAARPSSAAIPYKEVVGADGVTRLVAVDPRAVGAQVIGTGERYGTGVDGAGVLPLAQPAVSVTKTVAVPAPASNVFASPTIGEAESQKAEAISQAKLQAEKQAAFPKSQKAIEDWDNHARDIETTLSDVKQGLNTLSPLSSGISRKLAARVPGTLEYNVVRALDTIKANIGFDRLSAMRLASPTGGALGNVSDRDLSALQESIANLDIGQDLPILINNLDKINKRYQELTQSLHSSFSTEYKDFLPKGGIPPPPEGTILVAPRPVQVDASGNAPKPPPGWSIK